MGSGSVDDATRRRLTADCSRCAALCCVGPGFTASSEFAITKPGGHPCPHLEPDFRCGIHDRLRPLGFSGCVGYDCFGAGQRVTQELFGGRDWREGPATAAAMFEALGVLRQLHELLWYLSEAVARTESAAPADVEGRALGRELTASRARVEAWAALPPAELCRVDVASRRREVGVLLARASTRIRDRSRSGGGPAAGARNGAGDRVGPDRAGADLTAAALAGADLRAASLRGACLIGADLRRADLRSADLLGADLRGADLSGADLRDALFLLRSQLESATGDGGTRLPVGASTPGHWLGRNPAAN